MNVHLFVIGRGKMRDLVMGPGVPGVESYSNDWHGHFDIKAAPSKDELMVAFHCGSGRQFPMLVDYCERWKVPMIQASSSLKENGDKDGKDIPLPINPGFPLIKAPNLSLATVALMRVLPELGRMMQSLGAKTGVVEAHQASKTSAPITAQNIAGYFGLPPTEVLSFRNEWQHRLLGVDERYLGGFARHIVMTEACGTRLKLVQEVDGRDTYRHGLGVLIQCMVQLGDKLTNGIHEAGDILFS